jgi:flagellar motility protein MotE (MotC chaperone)
MSDILGQMSPDAAERLTTEMAHRADGNDASSDGDLPKIEGKVMPPKPN